MNKDQWISVIDCHFCSKLIPTKEAISTPVDFTITFFTHSNIHTPLYSKIFINKLNELGL